ncbi:ATP synthase F1 subunit epsilon [Candidatus Dojkabacteria bacterium]|uniref:ATP synthase epsilon chain n=1 Tax=Candidatus Dojkabacteria bacterium TaxID=2099670 RepID=A0A955RMB5_9BACT|nr:ATP synthase F1 subunit epsilon [Candidatus Dojkabacteria bacterium]
MTVKLVTPQGIIIDSNKVDKLTIPTEEGIITILEDHVPMISIVSTGEVVVGFENDTDDEILAISKGILEIGQNSEIHILADTAERAPEIDIDRAEQARLAAEEFLKKQHNLEDVDFARIQAKIEKELARVNVGKKWRK